jgi:hypothetical protein
MILPSAVLAGYVVLPWYYLRETVPATPGGGERESSGGSGESAAGAGGDGDRDEQVKKEDVKMEHLFRTFRFCSICWSGVGLIALVINLTHSTLNPNPHTLHPAPYTLHPTPFQTQIICFYYHWYSSQFPHVTLSLVFLTVSARHAAARALPRGAGERAVRVFRSDVRGPGGARGWGAPPPPCAFKQKCSNALVGWLVGWLVGY